MLIIFHLIAFARKSMPRKPKGEKTCIRVSNNKCFAWWWELCCFRQQQKFSEGSGVGVHQHTTYHPISVGPHTDCCVEWNEVQLLQGCCIPQHDHISERVKTCKNTSGVFERHYKRCTRIGEATMNSSFYSLGCIAVPKRDALTKLLYSIRHIKIKNGMNCSLVTEIGQHIISFWTVQYLIFVVITCRNSISGKIIGW